MQQRNAGWHRSNMASKLLLLCHKSDTISASQKRCKQSVATGSVCYKKASHKRSSSEMEADIPGTSKRFTRSVTDCLSKVLCFFYQLDSRWALFWVRTVNSGKALRQVAEISKDLLLMTRLSNAISANDVHAIDHKYHKLCWTQRVSCPQRSYKWQCHIHSDGPADTDVVLDRVHQHHHHHHHFISQE